MRKSGRRRYPRILERDAQGKNLAATQEENWVQDLDDDIEVILDDELERQVKINGVLAIWRQVKNKACTALF